MAPNFSESNSCNGTVPEMRNQQTVIPTKGEDIQVFLSKLLDRVLSARVNLERLPNEVVNKYRATSQNQQTRSFFTDEDQNPQDTANLRKVICTKCKLKGKNFKGSDAKCSKCGNRLVYECIKCGGQFKSRSRINYHLLKTCNYLGDYHCLLCDHKSVHKNSLMVHIRGVHSIKLNDIEKYLDFRK